MPQPIAAKLVAAGKLVPVLERFAPMAPGVFLYYPSRRQMLPKLRAFVDHVKNNAARNDGQRERINRVRRKPPVP